MTKKIPVDCYSRVVGYLRPVSSWNDAKRQEFKDRKTYAVGEEETWGSSDLELAMRISQGATLTSSSEEKGESEYPE